MGVYIRFCRGNSFETICSLIVNYCKEKNLHLQSKKISSNKYIIEFEKENKFGIELNEEKNITYMKFYILEGNEKNIKDFIKEIMNREWDT